MMTQDADQILDAALAHVPFDGWSEETLNAAIEDIGVSREVARTHFPRGAVDLALAFHRRGDAEMAAQLAKTNLASMRIRDRITHAVKLRLEIAIPHKEAVRRGSTLFALPIYAADGAKALWETSDAIWTALGDPSDDINWYTKRATLSGVYAGTVLYWLGDESLDNQATWDFLDRRIENVMQVEKAKAAVRGNALLKSFLAGPMWIADRIKAPGKPMPDMPGRWTRD